MFKEKRRWVSSALAAVFLLLPLQCAAAGKVGIVSVEGQYANAPDIQEIVEALGYGSEFIGEDMLAEPGELNSFGCIILSYRHSRLYEEEYRALAGYVEEGGTLFLLGTAAYWMAENPENRLERPLSGIRGGGPLEKVTGVRIELPYMGRVEKFRVVGRSSYTAGLQDEFTYETRPPYDIHDERNIRWTEVKRLVPGKAETLIESEAYYEEITDPDTRAREYNMEETVTSAFLTVNKHGKGECVWLACRADVLILRRSEPNILRIFNNVLSSSLK